jgi:hypothetical protein
MKKRKEKQSTEVDNNVNNNPEYDRKTLDPEEVAAERRAIKNTLYDSSYRSSGGRWKQHDEPGEPKKTEYLTIAPAALKKQKQWDARQRLKSKKAVPTRGGKKLFDNFMQEANAQRQQHIT